MKIKGLLWVALLVLPLAAGAQQHRRKVRKADAETREWKYEITPVSVGAKGSVVVAVWSDSANPVVAGEQAKKNAVHGLIFKGMPANGAVPGKRPLVPASTGDEQQQRKEAEYFDRFFEDGGAYMRFVTLTSEEQQVTKIDRRKYRVGVVVVVSYDELRRELENRGIVRKLDAGF